MRRISLLFPSYHSFPITTQHLIMYYSCPYHVLFLSLIHLLLSSLPHYLCYSRCIQSVPSRARFPIDLDLPSPAHFVTVPCRMRYASAAQQEAESRSSNRTPFLFVRSLVLIIQASQPVANLDLCHFDRASEVLHQKQLVDIELYHTGWPSEHPVSCIRATTAHLEHVRQS